MSVTLPNDSLERLPITLGYFRLWLRVFGDTPDRRAAVLSGTGVDDAQLADPSADISVFQQLRQIDNLADLYGEGWPFLAPDLLGTAAHGAVGVAVLTATDVGSALKVIARYSGVRAPFATRRLVQAHDNWSLEFMPFAGLTEHQWRAVNEANFLSLRAALGAVLGHPPIGARYRFTVAAPAYEDLVRSVLGDGVSFGEPVAAFSLPVAELGVRSPYADPSLHARALDELEQAVRRLSDPANLKGRVEHLLLTNPSGRLDSAAAAKALGVSRRTLVRRLNDVGCRYRDLLEHELEVRALRLQAEGKLTHAEISERLGYADPTSFSRARRRWSKGHPARGPGRSRA